MKIRYDRVPIDSVRPYPGNARRGSIPAIRESLRIHGQYRPIVVQESSTEILAGNHTWLAAKAEGWESIDIGIVDVDDEQARKIVLADNRTNDLAVYDDQALADLLAELDTLDGTAFDQASVDALLATLGPGGFKKAELEQVIKLPNNPRTRPGEVITLGAHKLYCDDFMLVGSCCEADMVWTDPPYGVAYFNTTEDHMASENHRTDGKGIANEDLSPEELYRFRHSTASALHSILRPGGAYYLHVAPGPDQAYWINALETHNLKPRQVLQWIKDQFVFGRSDYHYRNESILYGWRDGSAHKWNGGRSQDSVWEYDRPKRSKDHPTIKPVELAIRAIENSSEQGDTVFDPFAGSGTILVAAMQTGRRAVMVEIDPAYCDVIIERYERLTGEEVRREECR